jgi:hypothetical protein
MRALQLALQLGIDLHAAVGACRAPNLSPWSLSLSHYDDRSIDQSVFAVSFDFLF